MSRRLGWTVVERLCGGVSTSCSGPSPCASNCTLFVASSARPPFSWVAVVRALVTTRSISASGFSCGRASRGGLCLVSVGRRFVLVISRLRRLSTRCMLMGRRMSCRWVLCSGGMCVRVVWIVQGGVLSHVGPKRVTTIHSRRSLVQSNSCQIQVTKPPSGGSGMYRFLAFWGGNWNGTLGKLLNPQSKQSETGRLEWLSVGMD